MILSQDRERGRISLSTKKLEPTPGDMLKDPALVYEKADEMAATFRCALPPPSSLPCIGGAHVAGQTSEGGRGPVCVRGG